LVIEQAVVKAASAGNPYEYLINRIGGVILLGTPHQGSKSQKWGSVLANLAHLVELGETDLIKDVDEKSMKIFDLIYEFMQIMTRTDLVKAHAVICFCENTPTDYLRRFSGWGGWVRGKISSIVGFLF
jgi:hypothetical protein